MTNHNLNLNKQFILLLICKIKSARTIYNIEQISRNLGFYEENLFTALKDLQKLGLVKSVEIQAEPSVYKPTNEGVNFVVTNEKLILDKAKAIITNKDFYNKLLIR